MQFRSGSSKGLYFLADDLPANEAIRNDYLLAAVGRDNTQIDGLGGATPATSKVAIVGPSTHPDADVDFLFVQVLVGEDRVDTTPNCGNILVGVGPFAIEAGLIKAKSKTTIVTVNMLNSGKLCELNVQTPNGEVYYQGDTQIDGVPGSAAPIVCNYLDIAGSICGHLLPTDNTVDTIDDIDLTCIDNGMPVALVSAKDLNISGYESPKALEADEQFTQKLEALRLKAGPIMNLGDVSEKALPVICVISEATSGGAINTRSFFMGQCHNSIGVFIAVSVATACVVPGTIANQIVNTQGITDETVLLKHPSGNIEVSLNYQTSNSTTASNNSVEIKKAGIIRTARLLAKGELYIPGS